jgi:co-chaperonin GroES (HSP10)
MTHPHVGKIYTDEQANSTVGPHQLPVPMNWKVLIQPHEPKRKTEGGIFLPTETIQNEEYLTAYGVIAAMGDLAYRDRDTGEKWKTVAPSIGQKVTYGKYAGQKLVVNGVKFLLLNDDEITSIIPEGVEVAAYVP